MIDTLGRPTSVLARHRFLILLVALLLLLLFVPAMRSLSLAPLAARLIVSIAFLAMLASATYAVASSRRVAAICGLLLAISVVLQVVSLTVNIDAIEVGRSLVSAGFLGFVCGVILRHLFQDIGVTTETIFASLCVYLLLGVMWAHAYVVIDIVDPGSFRLTPTDDGDVSMRFSGVSFVNPLYYSFVTLTTLGYGDIIPLSPTARMFATVEAITGQLYLVVLVARLVGLHIARAIERDSPSDERV